MGSGEHIDNININGINNPTPITFNSVIGYLINHPAITTFQKLQYLGGTSGLGLGIAGKKNWGNYFERGYILL